MGKIEGSDTKSKYFSRRKRYTSERDASTNGGNRFVEGFLSKAPSLDAFKTKFHQIKRKLFHMYMISNVRRKIFLGLWKSWLMILICCQKMGLAKPIGLIIMIHNQLIQKTIHFVLDDDKDPAETISWPLAFVAAGIILIILMVYVFHRYRFI